MAFILILFYGQARMQEEVKIFREKLKDVEAQCVEDYRDGRLKIKRKSQYSINNWISQKMKNFVTWFLATDSRQ